MGMWMDKIYYDGKFVVGDDIFHRFFELVFFVVLATAVLHIQPVGIMSNGAEHVSMFAFSLVVLIANILNLARIGELYCFGSGAVVSGRKLVQEDCKRVSIMNVPYLVLILAGTAIAGMEYFGSNSSSSSHEVYPVKTEGNYSHRVLASTSIPSYADPEEHAMSDLPISLILAGYTVRVLVMSANVIFFAPSGGKHKEV
jgi:hypothetical protein